MAPEAPPIPPNRLMYWVEPGRLLAGGYPGHADPGVARRTLCGLLDCGVSAVVNLMEEAPRGTPAYAGPLQELAQAQGRSLVLEAFPIEDHEVPDPQALDRLLGWIAAHTRTGGRVYAHCWGGRGRTGVLAGAWLLARGLSDSEGVLGAIARLRQGAPGASPETPEQAAFLQSLTLTPRLTGTGR